MSTASKRKLRYGAFGACLGISIYKKLESQSPNNYIKSPSIGINPLRTFCNYYSTTATAITSFSSFNFKIVNFCLLGLFLFVNFIKWAVFGKLTNNEIRNLKHKINYTVWEFCFGFMIFYYNTYQTLSSKVSIKNEFLKFGGLFLCVLLLKCFHYLSVDRVHTIFNDSSNRSTENSITFKYQFLRFAFGLVLLNLIDGLLIHRFFGEVYHNYYLITSNLSIENNILVAIFGFEILHIFPLIVLTCLKYGLNYYEYMKFQEFDEFTDDLKLNWNETKLRVICISEFLVNLIRFGMLCIFSAIFLYFYTFPMYIMPSSYLSLRVLIIKTRSLINFKKRQIKLQKLVSPDEVEPGGRCIICFEDLSLGLLNDVRSLENCSHTFHYCCLKNWVNYSSSCPICRDRI